MAVARARMHEREHRQVVSLQDALLPKRLPDLPGIDAAFRYIPGSLDTEVGGDWYDLFGFPDGRLGMVVGDVIGKGVTAAAGMGRVRAALRALAFTDPSPRAVLAGLDRLFDATENAESLTTVVYAVYDPADGSPGDVRRRTPAAAGDDRRGRGALRRRHPGGHPAGLERGAGRAPALAAPGRPRDRLFGWFGGDPGGLPGPRLNDCARRPCPPPTPRWSRCSTTSWRRCSASRSRTTT